MKNIRKEQMTEYRDNKEMETSICGELGGEIEQWWCRKVGKKV